MHNRMKRFLIVLILGIFCAAGAVAQKVTDAKALEYAKECYSQGMQIEQAVKTLQSKGVSIDQMKRLEGSVRVGMLDTDDLTSKQNKEKSNTRQMRTTKQDQDAKEKLAIDSLVQDQQEIILDEEPQMTKQDSLNRIYGHDIFRNKELSFTPNLQLATPGNYVIGAGDELGISIYGASEVDLSQTVTPEGRIFVSGLGPVSLKGLTIDQARTKLRRELSAIYGGLANGTASLDVALNNVRSIQVNVMGEVFAPGTYTPPLARHGLSCALRRRRRDRHRYAAHHQDRAQQRSGGHGRSVRIPAYRKQQGRHRASRTATWCSCRPIRLWWRCPRA